MNILGTGIVSALGRGVESLQSALRNGAPAPSMIEVPFQESPFPVYAVAKETLKDPKLRSARRADRFSKMATLAACDAVSDAGVELVPERTGIVLSTAFGPHPTVFNFLDEILEYGDAGTSPTVFSHSVHNAAASYISVALGLAGPAMTVTSLTDPFRQSLVLAKSWLQLGVCDRVLVGGVEECGAVMEYIVSEKLRMADGKLVPFFAEEEPAVIPGEGAVFFLLGRENRPLKIELESDKNPDLWAVDFEAQNLPQSAPAGCWSHLIGSSPLSSAVNCAAAGLMLQEQTGFAESSLIPIDSVQPAVVGCAGRTEFYLRTE